MISPQGSSWAHLAMADHHVPWERKRDRPKFVSLRRGPHLVPFLPPTFRVDTQVTHSHATGQPLWRSERLRPL